VRKIFRVVATHIDHRENLHLSRQQIPTILVSLPPEMSPAAARAALSL
jgi:hypothetical protein